MPGQIGRTSEVKSKPVVEDELCPLCKKTNENMIECDRCNKWFCTPCVNITAKELEVIGKKRCHWFCQTCEKPAIQAIVTDLDIEQRCNAYEKNDRDGGKDRSRC